MKSAWSLGNFGHPTHFETAVNEALARGAINAAQSLIELDHPTLIGRLE